MKRAMARHLVAGALAMTVSGCAAFRGAPSQPTRSGFRQNAVAGKVDAVDETIELSTLKPPHLAKPTPGQELKIQSGHVLLVRVMSRNRVEIEEKALRVSATGHATLPLLGDVKVAGYTREMTKALLSTLYAEYIRNPAVIVDFVAAANGREPGSPWGYVTVLGCVKQPGNVNIPATGNLTVTAAIQECGGLAVGARHANVQVVRYRDDGERETRRLDLHKIDRNGRPAGEIPLRNGDVVFVPEGLF